MHGLTRGLLHGPLSDWQLEMVTREWERGEEPRAEVATVRGGEARCQNVTCVRDGMRAGQHPLVWCVGI